MHKSLGLIFLLTLISTSQLEAKGVVRLSGKEIRSRQQLFVQMARELKFPAFFNHSLDSLYDVLITDVRGENIIKIKNLNLLKARLGDEFSDELIRTILDASEENPRLILVLE